MDENNTSVQSQSNTSEGQLASKSAVDEVSKQSDTGSKEQEGSSAKTEDKVNEQSGATKTTEGGTSSGSGKSQEPTGSGNSEGTEQQQRRDTTPTVVHPTGGSVPSGDQKVFKPKGPGFLHSRQRKQFERYNTEGA